MTLRSWLKDSGIRVASRFGYIVKPKWELDDLPLENHLRETFDKLGVDCVIDVGANKGQFSTFLRQRTGFRGPIFSFEPIRSNFQTLENAAKDDPGWQCIHSAFGSSAGHLTINIMQADTFSSFLTPEHLEGFAESNQIRDTEECVVQRFDEWLAQAGLPYKRIYLKLDTQGFDLEVLRGAEGALDRVVALQSEVSFIPLYQGMPDYRQSIDHITSIGFRVSNLFRVSAKDGVAVEFDCVFVRNSGQI